MNFCGFFFMVPKHSVVVLSRHFLVIPVFLVVLTAFGHLWPFLASSDSGHFWILLAAFGNFCLPLLAPLGIFCQFLAAS